jgi:hypothetical protein
MGCSELVLWVALVRFHAWVRTLWRYKSPECLL